MAPVGCWWFCAVRGQHAWAAENVSLIEVVSREWLVYKILLRNMPRISKNFITFTNGPE